MINTEPDRFNDPILDQLDPPIPVIESTQSVFHDLMSCIIEQQIHYRSTKGQFKKLLDKAGLSNLTPANIDQFTPVLSQTKLSQRKHDTLAQTIDFFQTNQIDWPSLADDEVRHTLAALKGIGDWTIDMILLYTLSRPDVFPAGDYHLKKMMSSLYNLNEDATLKSHMTAIAESWRPYRSHAVLKLFAWKEWQKQQLR